MSDVWKYRISWNPKKDITTYELAQCIPFTMMGIVEIDDWDILDENVTRHFRVEKINYTAMIKKTGNKLKNFME